jgi:hypothetical protein
VLSRIAPAERAPARCVFDWAAVSTRGTHEHVCGDCVAHRRTRRRLAVMVADGPRPRPLAAEAACSRPRLRGTRLRRSGGVLRRRRNARCRQPRRRGGRRHILPSGVVRYAGSATSRDRS